MFNYNLSSENTSIALVSQVRLELGDTTCNSGVLPGGANLQDEEVLHYLNAYGNDTAQAVGALCGVLSRHWAIAADVQVGPRRESLSQVARAWAEHANNINPDAVSFVMDVDRYDGYDVG